MLFICCGIYLFCYMSVFLVCSWFFVIIWKAYFPSLNFSNGYFDCIHFRGLCILDYLLILREKAFIIVMCFMTKYFLCVFTFFLFFSRNLCALLVCLLFFTCCFFLKLTMHFILGGSKITADGDCSHEIKRRLLLGRKVMTNLDSIFKSRDITLLAKVRLVKAMVFPVVMYGCESWTVKKAEDQRSDAFELWCWRRLLRVPWTARRSNQSILKEIGPGYSLEGMMLK